MKIEIIISSLDTAIRWAAQNGHLEIVKLLLQDNRVDPLIINSYGIMYIHLNLLHLIVVNLYGRNKTLLYMAAEKGYKPIVEFLVKSGANVYQTVENETPYTIAQKYQHKEIIEYFDKLKKWIPGILNI